MKFRDWFYKYQNIDCGVPGKSRFPGILSTKIYLTTNSSTKYLHCVIFGMSPQPNVKKRFSNRRFFFENFAIDRTFHTNSELNICIKKFCENFFF